MSAPFLDGLIPKLKCCAYLRLIHANGIEYFGSGLAELLGNRPDLPNVAQWGAFQTEINPDDWARVPMRQSSAARSPNGDWDIYQVRLKDAAGRWTEVRFHETDYSIDDSDGDWLRLGAAVRFEQRHDFARTCLRASQGWRSLSQGLPVILARLDGSAKVIFANDLAESFLENISELAAWNTIDGCAAPVRLNAVIFDAVVEAMASRCVVSRCVNHTESDLVAALHFIPNPNPSASAEGVLMIGHLFGQQRERPVESDLYVSQVLPTHRRQITGAAAGGALDLRGQGCILFADDDPPIRTIGRRILEHLGFRVILASGGRNAVEEFGRYPDDISLVILDLTMPEMSGAEALHEIRRIRPQIPVILTSGFGEQDVLERVAQASIDGFLKKPFRTEDLSDLVRSVLESRPVSGVARKVVVPSALAINAGSRARGDR
jgi:CheY-like chemotaxis protein